MYGYVDGGWVSFITQMNEGEKDMKSRKMRKVLPITMAAIMALTCFPAMADSTDDAWGVDDATKTDVSFTIDGDTVEATWLVDNYLSSKEDTNALVNIWIPEGATADSEILYMVNNGGWNSNGYDANLFLEDGATYETDAITSTGSAASPEGRSDFCAKALKEGYIIVSAGLRSRNPDNTKSPVTVADAKAVIRYLRHNEIGNTDRIFITGLSGGGALSVAIGSDGNSSDFYEELYAIGAAGIEKSSDTYVSTINDDVFGVVAYCPITDLGHADGSYEFAYASTRYSLYEQGYRADTKAQTFALSDLSRKVAPLFAEEWAAYVNDLGIAGTDNAYDTEKMQASGTLYEEMEALLLDCLQGALDELGTAAFIETLEARECDAYDVVDTVDADWTTNWLTIKAGQITEFDLEGYLEYVAIGQLLKPGIAFTNKGIPAMEGLFYNENNLFGLEGEAYGYVSPIAYAESGLTDSWETYWGEREETYTLQMRMVDSIAYLVDDEGDDAGDSAPYWWVRHGSLDRDTSFANQTLLYLAMKNDASIEVADFAFAFDKTHCGNYDLDDAMAFMEASIADAAADDTVTPPADDTTDVPSTDDTKAPTTDTEDDKTTSPSTADSFGFLAVAVVAAAGVAFAARRRIAR